MNTKCVRRLLCALGSAPKPGTLVNITSKRHTFYGKEAIVKGYVLQLKVQRGTKTSVVTIDGGTSPIED